MTDAEKLRTVAKWFDVHDAKTGNTNNDVQKDLLRIAADLERVMTIKDGEDVYAPKQSMFKGEFKQDREEVKPRDYAKMISSVPSLRQLCWRIDREVWAKVSIHEATESWGREQTGLLILSFLNEIVTGRK